MAKKQTDAQKQSNKVAWIEAGFQFLSKGGIDSVRVDRISKEIGLTRGSFYWHFKNRAELLDAMLELWHQQGTKNIIELIEKDYLSPNLKLSTLFKLSTEPTDAKYGGKFAEVAIRIWGSRDEKVQKVIKQVDYERIQFVNKILSEMGLDKALASMLSEVIYNAFIGIMSRDLSDDEISRIVQIATAYLEDQAIGNK